MKTVKFQISSNINKKIKLIKLLNYFVLYYKYACSKVQY